MKKLKAYQRRAMFLIARHSGKTATMQIATGAGKTIMFADPALRFNAVTVKCVQLGITARPFYSLGTLRGWWLTLPSRNKTKWIKLLGVHEGLRIETVSSILPYTLKLTII